MWGCIHTACGLVCTTLGLKTCMSAIFIFMAYTCLTVVVHMQLHACITQSCVCLCDFSSVSVVVCGFMNVACVGWGWGGGGSLLIILNIKQLEVMKYLGSTGSQ